jgi:hypothetical protein
LRQIQYQHIDESTERQHLKLAIGSLTRLTGSAPLGWCTSRDSTNRPMLSFAHGGVFYDSDCYGDDSPL